MKKINIAAIMTILLMVGMSFARNSMRMTELAIAREIAAVKEKMADHRMPSFVGSIKDVTAVTLLGAGMGALTGVAHAAISQGMVEDVVNGFALPGADREEVHALFLANAGRIGVHVLQGAVAGFTLGLVGQAGSLPQMGKGKLVLVLAIQNAITLLLDCVADHVGVNVLERMAREGLARARVPFGGMVNAVGGRRALIQAAILVHGENVLREVVLAGVCATLAAQLVALLAVFPEALVVRSSRKDDGQKYQALEASLKELQSVLKGCKNDSDDIELD
jgi:hypothetical protein